MKRSDTLFRHKVNLLYDTGASIREMVNTIIAKTKNLVIDLRAYNNEGVCEMVGTWIMHKDGGYGYWGIFTAIYVNKEGKVILVAENDDYIHPRKEDMYGYTLDELIYLHDEIEKIYKFVVSVNSLA